MQIVGRRDVKNQNICGNASLCSDLRDLSRQSCTISLKSK